MRNFIELSLLWRDTTAQGAAKERDFTGLRRGTGESQLGKDEEHQAIRITQKHHTLSIGCAQ